MKYLYLIGSNLRRKRLRTLLTILSILVAFLLYGFLSAIRMGLEGGVSVAGVDRLVVRHKVSIIQLLPESYRARIERIPGVGGALDQTWFGGVYQDPMKFFARIVVNPQGFLAMYPEYLLSESEKKAWFEKRTGAIAGRKLADRFGWKLGDRIPIQGTIWMKAGGDRGWEFDLVGIYEGRAKATDTTQFFFRYDYFDEARAFGKGQVGWYTVRVKDPAQAGEIARRIDEEFANSPAETKTETEGAFVRGFARQIGDIGKITAGILVAVFFTILLVAGNTMAQSVRERTEELGVLKALGFTNAQVLGMVLAESCLIALLGGFIGLTLAWAIISRGDPTGGALPTFHFPLQDLFLGIGIVLALGLVAGVLPALQAMRLRIADALRRN